MPISDPERRREYHRRYMREVWYPKNRDKQLAATAASTRRIAALITSEKKARGCTCSRCKQRVPVVALDFHHRDSSKKLFQIAQFKTFGAGVERVKREMEKCDLVCANCHRVLHAEEREAMVETTRGRAAR